MSQMFTVRWPLFARLEAALLFPVACAVASEIAPLRAYVGQQLVATLAPLLYHLGISNQAIFWAGMAIAAFLPYVLLLVAADRFLTVRKGFALLSFIAIAVWSVAAARAPALVAQYLPEPFLREVNWLSSSQKAALTVFGVALLLHLKALWTGVRDQGEVADGLLADRDAYPYPRRNESDPQDVYHRQTADFRGWQLQKQLSGLGSGPREHPVVQFLTGLTWAGLSAVVGVAYLIWYGFPGFGPGMRYHEPTPIVEAGPVRPTASAKSATLVATPPLRPAPAPAVPPPAEHVAMAPPALPPPAERVVVAPPPMPNVQRPTAMSASVEVQGRISGPNEAIAQRGNDGSFAFDAVVNGSHVRMLFDTGATVVGLRAEDADRLGIQVSNLTYSAKIKTANGTAEVAPITIDTMIIGNITLRKVSGFVAKEGALPQNLLGQTFLARLSGFNVENNLLILRGR
jgi:clan AA aspartic protease (TIGR02281 family)